MDAHRRGGTNPAPRCCCSEGLLPSRQSTRQPIASAIGVAGQHQTALAMALSAPIGERPVVRAIRAAERKRVNDAMTVEQCETAEHRVSIQCSDANAFEAGLLTAKSDQVWVGCVRLTIAREHVRFPSEQVNNV